MLSTAFAVAMDAVAVAALAGMTRGRASWREVLSLSATFGIFQAVMPAIGYAGGALFRDAISEFDHWVAFVLLAAGLTFALLEVPVGVAVAIIGLTTFLLCIPAARLGARLGSPFAHRAEFFGGVVLIAIGTNLLIQHLSGGA